MKDKQVAKRLLMGLLLLASLACAISTGSESEEPSSELDVEVLVLQQTLQALNSQDAEQLQAELMPELQKADIALGDLSSQNAEVFIPAGAFEGQNEIAFETLNTTPVVDMQGVEPLGAVISVSTGGEAMRSSEPIKITLKFDSQDINERGEVLIGYYNNQHGWELFAPDEIDLDRGEVSFVTYHFSKYGVMRAEDQVRIDQFLQKHATEEYVRRHTLAQNSKEFENMVKAILREGMNVEDNRVLEIIAKGVIEQIPFGDIPYGDIGIALHGFNEKYEGQTDLAKIITENTIKYIGEKTLDDDNPFSEVTGDFGSVIAFGQAYHKLLKNKGDPRESLEIMADHIMSNIPVVSSFYKAGKTAVELVNHTQELWKNNEIEKAFQVYSQGGEGGRYGYSVDSILVDPDAWNKIMMQNKSSFERVAGDYMTAYCRAQGLDISQLGWAERDRIRAEGLEHLRKQFDERMARRAEIDRDIEKNRKLMQMFADRNLLERNLVDNPMFTGHEDLEMLLSRLNNMVKKFERDLGRSEIVDRVDWDATDPFERSNKIPYEVLVELTYQWYNKGLRFNPDAYNAIIKNLQARLDKNLGIGPLQIADMVDETIKSYQPQGEPKKGDPPIQKRGPTKDKPKRNWWKLF